MVVGIPIGQLAIPDEIADTSLDDEDGIYDEQGYWSEWRDICVVMRNWDRMHHELSPVNGELL